MQTQTRGRVLLVEGARGASAFAGLADAGFEMRRVSGEPEAVELANKETFDVLVVDLDLPRIDGLTLIRRLRQSGSAPEVVWLTSHYTSDLAAQAVELGVVQLLQKPTETKALERVVDAAVGRSRHLVAVLRAIMRPNTRPRSVPATDAKNEFGAVLESAVQDGAVLITKHDAPRAVLVSVDLVTELLAKQEPNLEALTQQFDELVARMQTPTARAAARHLFGASPKEFGEAALAAVKKRHE